MTTVSIELNLSEQTAQQAKRAGLLTGAAIERLIEKAVRREAATNYWKRCSYCATQTHDR